MGSIHASRTRIIVDSGGCWESGSRSEILQTNACRDACVACSAGIQVNVVEVIVVESSVVETAGGVVVSIIAGSVVGIADGVVVGNVGIAVNAATTTDGIVVFVFVFEGVEIIVHKIVVLANVVLSNAENVDGYDLGVKEVLSQRFQT